MFCYVVKGAFHAHTHTHTSAQWIQNIRGYIVKLQSILIANMDYINWSFRQYIRRGGNVIKGLSLFQPAESITLLEYMKIWCDIQVIIYRLFQAADLILFFYRFATLVVIVFVYIIKRLIQITQICFVTIQTFFCFWVIKQLL